MTSTSRLCTFADFETRWYRDYLVGVDANFSAHRKHWEWGSIYRALDERDQLRPGRRGLGFAVGTEPLPAAFHRLGCDILATDQEPTETALANWDNGQICKGDLPPGVAFRHVDMRDLPDDLGGFDFLWSACSFEHLGTLEAGLDFVVKSTRYLKPGGYAVHTTEYLLSDPEKTLESGPSVFYRQTEIADLASRLESVGCALEPVNWATGDHPVDLHVDHFPFSFRCHLKLEFDGFVLTSLLLIIRRLAEPR